MSRFFVTPSAVDRWREWYPHHAEEEARATILDYADDATDQGHTEGGLRKLRAKRPWRGYLLVAAPERGRILPTVVDLMPPYPGWKPAQPKPAPGPRGGPRPGAGRPKQEGRSPDYHCKLPADVQDHIRSKPPGWLEQLIRATM